MAWINSPLRNRQAKPVVNSTKKDLPPDRKFVSIENYRNAFKIHNEQLQLIEIDPLDTKAGISKRNSFISGIIAGFFPVIDDAIANKTYYDDDILVSLMIWLINAQQIDRAIKLSILLIEQGKTLPDNFSRKTNIQTFVCRHINEWASDLLKKDESATPYIDIAVTQIADDTMPTVVHSQILATAAKHKLLDNTPEALKAGLEYCNKAMLINPEKHGCKTLKEDIQSALKRF